MFYLSKIKNPRAKLLVSLVFPQQLYKMNLKNNNKSLKITLWGERMNFLITRSENSFDESLLVPLVREWIDWWFVALSPFYTSKFEERRRELNRNPCWSNWFNYDDQMDRFSVSHRTKRFISSVRFTGQGATCYYKETYSGGRWEESESNFHKKHPASHGDGIPQFRSPAEKHSASRSSGSGYSTYARDAACNLHNKMGPWNKRSMTPGK